MQNTSTTFAAETDMAADRIEDWESVILSFLAC